MKAPSDFNDLKALKGLGETGRQLTKNLLPSAQIASAAGPNEADGRAPLGPPTMAPEGFPPLLKEIVEAACRSSEAHPVAVAANALAWFSCAVGRGPFQRIGDATIHCRPYMLIVGKSGKARKGTAEITVREVFKRADARLRERLGTEDVLHVHDGGLSSGEGLAYAIRDAKKDNDEKQ